MKVTEWVAFAVLFFAGPMLAMQLLVTGPGEWSGLSAVVTLAGLVLCGWACHVMAQVEPE